MKIRLTLLLAAAAYGAYVGLFRRRHLRWGATDEDAQRALPGDGMVSYPKLKTTRAVAIQAPEEGNDITRSVKRAARPKGQNNQITR